MKQLELEGLVKSEPGKGVIVQGLSLIHIDVYKRQVYGMVTKGGASYAVVVMFTTAITTGLASGLKLGEVLDVYKRQGKDM